MTERATIIIRASDLVEAFAGQVESPVERGRFVAWLRQGSIPDELRVPVLIEQGEAAPDKPKRRKKSEG